MRCAAFNVTDPMLRYTWTCRVTADNCITDGSPENETYYVVDDCGFGVLSAGMLRHSEWHIIQNRDQFTINNQLVRRPRGELAVDGGEAIRWRSGSDARYVGAGWTICWSAGASGLTPSLHCVSQAAAPSHRLQPAAPSDSAQHHQRSRAPTRSAAR